MIEARPARLAYDAFSEIADLRVVGRSLHDLVHRGQVWFRVIA